MIMGHELMALTAMNSSGLWMICTTWGCELKALNAMNNLGLLMTCKTL